MLSTIFFLPPAIRLFTFSRSALLSSPSTMRPSSATTATPSTSRFVILSAIFSSPRQKRPRRQPGPDPLSITVIARARHVIAAARTNQLPVPRLQPLGTDGTIPRSIFLRSSVFLLWRRSLQRHDGRAIRRSRSGLRAGRSRPWLHGMFHGGTVVSHPPAGEKRRGISGSAIRSSSPVREVSPKPGALKLLDE